MHTPIARTDEFTPDRDACVRRSPATILLLSLALALTAHDALARTTGRPRTEMIDMVVIHSTGGPTCDGETGKPVWIRSGSLDANMRFIEAHPQLGIHYMIDRDGTLRSSVPETQVAHHVLTRSGRSIGIELINDGDGRDAFPEPQLSRLVNLLRDIAHRHGITQAGIKRHSDLDHTVLPCDKTERRKVDPGPAFPYESILTRVFHPGSSDHTTETRR